MNLMVAVDSHWGIGYKGDLLVSIPEDKKLFREETTGKVIVMGRKTLESFPNGRPLPNRINVVLTRNEDFECDGAVVVHSTEEALEYLKQYSDDDIFVIGGAEIYRQFLPFCDIAHVTYIDYRYDADCFFENLDQSEEWELVVETEEMTYFSLEYYFRMYRRRKVLK